MCVFARSVLWVANPEETGFFVRLLLKGIGLSRLEAQGVSIRDIGGVGEVPESSVALQSREASLLKGKLLKDKLEAGLRSV